MNTIKKILGLVWMFLAPAIIWFLASQALAGLWYPIGVASICLFIGVIYLTNRVDKEVMD